MAQIRHLAIRTENPQQLAEFYRDVFGMTITGNGHFGDVWITDGHLDIALLLRHREEQQPGLHHFGFSLEPDEKTVVVERLKARGIEPSFPGPDRPFVEEKATDIDGNRYDLSTVKPSVADDGRMHVTAATKS